MVLLTRLHCGVGMPAERSGRVQQMIDDEFLIVQKVGRPIRSSSYCSADMIQVFQKIHLQPQWNETSNVSDG